MIFQESECKKNYPQFPKITQVNLIEAKKGSLRGFHSALEASNHWKIVTCLRGEVLDVTLDIRVNSNNFGATTTSFLSESDTNSLIIPPGFAHAMQCISSDSLVIYSTNVPFELNEEFEINPLSPEFLHLWTSPHVISERDSNAMTFQKFRESMIVNDK